MGGETPDGIADYGILMPFWIDTDAYNDRDREMFVCGVEFQMVYQRLALGMEWKQPIHRDNESRIRMMCGKIGAPCEIQPMPEFDDWSYCHAGG